MTRHLRFHYFGNSPNNGLRYPSKIPRGGAGGRDWAPSRCSPETREHHFIGTNFKPRKLLESAQTPTITTLVFVQGLSAYLSRCFSGRCVGQRLTVHVFSAIGF